MIEVRILSSQFCFVLLFYGILNIVQIALITLEVAIEGREIL